MIIGSAIGNHVTVYNVLFSESSVKIGDNAYIGFDCNIGNVDIGNDVLIADGVTILSGGLQHGTGNKDQAFKSQEGEFSRIEIGNGSWIGAGAIIMASVGVGVIVGAGSVVTKAIPDNQVVVGVPAKPIKRSTSS